MPKLLLPYLEHLRRKAIRDEAGCLLMTFGLRKDGYANVSFNHTTWLAHRVVWTLADGEIPAGFDVLHRCDVRRCIEIEHLFLGTDFDNQRDRVAKGRHSGWPTDQCGANNHGAVLCEADVLEIKALAAAREFSQKAIAARFGISQSTVSHIHSGKAWAHVSPGTPVDQP